MKNKNILITGASSGIGRATAEFLTNQGANVVLVSRDEQRLKTILKSLNGNNFYFKYDLSNLYDIKDIFVFCKKNNIKLDGMVHSAGIAPLSLIKDNDVDLMINTFSINYFSFVELVKYFQLPDYSNEHSSIVAVSSITAKKSGYRQVLYGSSKAAINSSVKLMAKELLNRHIRINSVLPGVTETGMLDELRKKSLNLDDNINKKQPLGIIQPNKIGELIYYLLSDESCYMTGLNIPIDGGALL